MISNLYREGFRLLCRVFQITMADQYRCQITGEAFDWAN